MKRFHLNKCIKTLFKISISTLHNNKKHFSKSTTNLNNNQTNNLNNQSCIHTAFTQQNVQSTELKQNDQSTKYNPNKYQSETQIQTTLNHIGANFTPQQNKQNNKLKRSVVTQQDPKNEHSNENQHDYPQIEKISSITNNTKATNKQFIDQMIDNDKYEQEEKQIHNDQLTPLRQAYSQTQQSHSLSQSMFYDNQNVSQTNITQISASPTSTHSSSHPHPSHTNSHHSHSSHSHTHSQNPL